MPFTTETANLLLNKVLRGEDFTPPSQLYVSIHTDDPGEIGANELNDSAYVRQPVSFNEASSKHSESTVAVEFTNMPSCTITHVGLWNTDGTDSSSSANDFWWGGQLSSYNPDSSDPGGKSVDEGDTLKIPSSDLNADLDV